MAQNTIFDYFPLRVELIQQLNILKKRNTEIGFGNFFTKQFQAIWQEFLAKKSPVLNGALIIKF
ncbi:MAG: hypothetical protein AAF902_02680 [Chloroflexota bacterium]